MIGSLDDGGWVGAFHSAVVHGSLCLALPLMEERAFYSGPANALLAFK